MEIAVVVAGISGLSCAYRLAEAQADVTLFEADSYFGGHSNTIDVACDGFQFGVDTGFLVFNDRAYPNLIALFDELGGRDGAKRDVVHGQAAAGGLAGWRAGGQAGRRAGGRALALGAARRRRPSATSRTAPCCIPTPTACSSTARAKSTSVSLW